jgi:nucleotide-binding universal stress UspA family protein
MTEPVKRILVGLGNSRTATSVTEHAIDIAKPRGAELVGLAVTDPVRLEWTGPRPIGVGVEEQTAELRKSRYERARADIAAAEETFATRCRAAGVAHRVNEETGDPFDVAEDLVRYHDMCVFGLQGLFEHGVVPEPVDALERLVSAGVRPVLAVGEAFRPIERVLVAYSGSIESAKTFKHFVQSGLYPEAVVRIVHFGHDEATARRRLEKSAGFFVAHGREVDTDHCRGDASRELVPYAEAWKADLIVAGNSSKNLLLRKLFGETALKLLRESPLPLYLAQ